MSLDISNALKDRLLGFIGAGNMAEAMIRGIVQNQLVPPDRILASDISGERREHISGTLHVETVRDNGSLVDQSNVIFLSVKPQAVPRVLNGIGPHMGPEKLLVSIVAGVPIKTLSAGMPEGPRIVRTMPQHARDGHGRGHGHCVRQSGASGRPGNGGDAFWPLGKHRAD